MTESNLEKLNSNKSKSLLVDDKIIEWDSSKEDDPKFLIKYYEGRIIYWSKYPENISKKNNRKFS